VLSEFADTKHREQAEGFLLSLGKFVLAFERVCAAMRFLVIFVLEKQGLNQGMAQVIIAKREGKDLGARDLQNLLAAVFSELPGLDEDDRKAVAGLVTSITNLTDERNRLVHSDWHLGVETAENELTAASFRFKASPSRGASIEEHWCSSSEVEEWTRKAKECQVRLQRLQYCVNQSGFKVATELGKSL
jgi:hypothetical protein